MTLDPQRSTEAATLRKNLQELVYRISHDLHEPLRGILGFSKLLLNESADAPFTEQQRRKYLQLINASSLRLQHQLAGLLTYSRVDSQARAHALVDMNVALGSALAELNVQTTYPGAVVHHDTLPTTTGDDQQLQSVLRALIENALQYSEAPAWVHISGHTRDDHTLYSVQDRGSGMPAQGLLKAFEPLVRLHPLTQNQAGMGLAVVKRIIQRHGGHVWAESSEGAGTTIHFTLPLSPAPNAP